MWVKCSWKGVWQHSRHQNQTRSPGAITAFLRPLPHYSNCRCWSFTVTLSSASRSECRLFVSASELEVMCFTLSWHSHKNHLRFSSFLFFFFLTSSIRLDPNLHPKRSVNTDAAGRSEKPQTVSSNSPDGHFQNKLHHFRMLCFF